MQVYRGLPILTNQAPAGWSGSGRSTTRRRSPSTSGSRTQRSTRSSPPGGRRSSSAGPGLYLRAALAELTLPPAPQPGERERLGAALRRAGRRARRTQRLAELDPEAAAAVHPNDRRRVVRSLELAGRDRPSATGSGAARRGIRRSSSGSTSRSRSSTARIDERTRAMFEAGVRAEARGARSQARSPRRPPTPTGSRTSPSTPTTRPRSRRWRPARDATPRTSANGCDAYPALLACLPIAPRARSPDAVLEVARARQRLPAGRAG